MTQAKGFLLAALCVLAALVAAAPARAQNCSTVCSNYIQGECSEHTTTCNYAPPKPNFGAIAYGPTSKAWGYSFGWGSQTEAQSAAMKQCGARAKDCEVAVWYQRDCGAVVSDTGTDYYWGVGDGTPAAVTQAQQACKKGGGKTCHPEVAECSR
jgi:Domain of unknown function (DUF4189)